MSNRTRHHHLHHVPQSGRVDGV